MQGLRGNMTYQEIKDYVQFEARQAEVHQAGSYESEPFAMSRGCDDEGNQVVEDETCMINAHLLGDEEHGYILVTEDDFDGATDDLGTDVYSTVEAALEA